MTQIQIHVIIVNYNTCDLTLGCLASLYAQTDPNLISVTVVDNASNDGSIAAIKAGFPQVNLIPSKTNLGFAQGCNLAAALRNDPYIFLLNPDTVILDRAVERLVNVAQDHPSSGIWGPRVLFEDGRINTTHCFRDFSVWSLFCSAAGLTALFAHSPIFNSHNYGGWPRTENRLVDAVSGCAFLIKSEIWRDLDGFDPIFFMYGEEADLCIRARKIGAQPMTTADAEIIHHTTQSYSHPADMWVHLLSAKMTLIDRHFGKISRYLARVLVKAAPVARVIASTAVDTITRRGVSPRRALWKDIWNRRDEWKNGFTGKN